VTEPLRAVFTVTVETKPGGDYYFDHNDFVRHVVPWIEGGLDDRDDIRDVTIAEQPAGPAPATDRAALVDRSPVADPPTALRVRVLREIIGRITSTSTGDSATEEVGAATVLAVLRGLLADLERDDRADLRDCPPDCPCRRVCIGERHNKPLAAVLPASIDQAAALSEAERTMLTYALDQAQEKIWSEDGFTDEDQAAVTSLRRVADEPQPKPQPRRGDAFEAWLKAQRDACEPTLPPWTALDDVLDTYRLHADTGTPLGEHVCEGRVVGDCDCLETAPAAEPPQPTSPVRACRYCPDPACPEDCPACGAPIHDLDTVPARPKKPPIDPVHILGIKADSEQPEAFTPPVHYERDDGVLCCVHAIPVGPDSCPHCRELHDDEPPAAVAQPDGEPSS
jgi:hypothetical protein